jgi:hypothetical protein
MVQKEREMKKALAMAGVVAMLVSGVVRPAQSTVADGPHRIPGYPDEKYDPNYGITGVFVDPTDEQKAACDAVTAEVLQNAIAARVIDHMQCAQEKMYKYPALRLDDFYALQMLVWVKDAQWLQLTTAERLQVWQLINARLSQRFVLGAVNVPGFISVSAPAHWMPIKE